METPRANTSTRRVDRVVRITEAPSAPLDHTSRKTSRYATCAASRVGVGCAGYGIGSSGVVRIETWWHPIGVAHQTPSRLSRGRGRCSDGSLCPVSSRHSRGECSVHLGGAQSVLHTSSHRGFLAGGAYARTEAPAQPRPGTRWAVLSAHLDGAHSVLHTSSHRGFLAGGAYAQTEAPARPLPGTRWASSLFTLMAPNRCRTPVPIAAFSRAEPMLRRKPLPGRFQALDGQCSLLTSMAPTRCCTPVPIAAFSRAEPMLRRKPLPGRFQALDGQCSVPSGRQPGCPIASHRTDQRLNPAPRISRLKPVLFHQGERRVHSSRAAQGVCLGRHLSASRERLEERLQWRAT